MGTWAFRHLRQSVTRALTTLGHLGCSGAQPLGHLGTWGLRHSKHLDTWALKTLCLAYFAYIGGSNKTL